uniref:Putative potassium channel toxin Tx682 n=1 Tax=Buthus israelis TaxID=2899555 RepID=B8XH39_BUTIS|nr:putative potassium channel toxin Tx682 [Buthus occitanus israelis]
MKFPASVLMIIIIYTMIISSHAQFELDIKCTGGADNCLQPCIDEYDTTKTKCINDRCNCYP